MGRPGDRPRPARRTRGRGGHAAQRDRAPRDPWCADPDRLPRARPWRSRSTSTWTRGWTRGRWPSRPSRPSCAHGPNVRSRSPPTVCSSEGYRSRKRRRNRVVASWRGSLSTCSGGPCSMIRPVLHEDDAVRRLAGEVHLVGHHDHRRAAVGEVLHDVQHLADQLGVERRSRLVEEEHLGLHAQRTGDGDALLLAARQAGRVLVALVDEADDLEVVLGALHAPWPSAA